MPGSRKQKGSSQKPVLGGFGQETDAEEGREGGWELKLLHRADELGLER